MDDLKTIFGKHKGLVTDKWSSYLEVYDKVFKEFRHKEVKILEIGVQNGGSLQIWRQFFRNAKIVVGCDINPKCAKLEFGYPNIEVVIGDACCKGTFERIKELSQEYDIVIDDGSHRSRDIVCNFLRYFQLLKEGGVYVVEDLHCSYWRDFSPSVERFSAIQFFKYLVDYVNREFWDEKFKEYQFKKISKLIKVLELEEFEIEEMDNLLLRVSELSFYNSLCIIRKSGEGGRKLGTRVIAGNLALVDESVLRFKKS